MSPPRIGFAIHAVMNLVLGPGVSPHEHEEDYIAISWSKLKEHVSENVSKATLADSIKHICSFQEL